MRYFNDVFKEALIGRFGELYQTEAQFHAAIDTLSVLLPYWVEGLAAEAEQRQEDYEERLQALKLSPLSPIKAPE